MAATTHHVGLVSHGTTKAHASTGQDLWVTNEHCVRRQPCGAVADLRAWQRRKRRPTCHAAPPKWPGAGLRCWTGTVMMPRLQGVRRNHISLAAWQMNY